MTEVTLADGAFYLLQAPLSGWDSSSYCLPWDSTPIRALSGSRSLQIMFLGKRGSKMAKGSFLGARAGCESSRTRARHQGTGCSEGFAQLSRRCSCSQPGSSSHKKDMAAPTTAPVCPTAALTHLQNNCPSSAILITSLVTWLLIPARAGLSIPPTQFAGP